MFTLKHRPFVRVYPFALMSPILFTSLIIASVMEGLQAHISRKKFILKIRCFDKIYQNWKLLFRNKCHFLELKEYH